jgi:CRP-like cAMP-binding protein
MSDHDPILLRRLIELRRFPMFAAAELGELATLAENVVEISHESGAIVARPPLLDAIHLILDGQIEVGAAKHGTHGAFGFLEVLARRPLPALAVAVGDTRTLRLTASDLREILEDNHGLLLIAIRELVSRTLAIHRSEPPSRRLAAAVPAPSPLGLVERMIVLRRQFPFAPPAPYTTLPVASHVILLDSLGRTAPLEAIALLAHASKETTWPAGAVMARTDEPARDAYFILDGNLRAVPADRDPSLLGPGAAVGLLEGLAGLRHAATIEVVAPVRALEVAGSVIFDVLEDHPELGLSVVESLATGVLDAAAAVDARTS